MFFVFQSSYFHVETVFCLLSSNIRTEQLWGINDGELFFFVVSFKPLAA